MPVCDTITLGYGKGISEIFYRHAMEIDKIFRYNRIVNRNMSGNRILVISENKEVFTWLI